jgi:hypothetical protein
MLQVVTTGGGVGEKEEVIDTEHGSSVALKRLVNAV